jgi:predicted AAA+ superfamily ATPase
MIDRPRWQARLTDGWTQVPIVWLTGPRRSGKTVLARQVPDALFLNCDLPSVADRLADPESFYHSVEHPVVVFDEVHQLPDPSRLLKIAADAFPRLKILATGSSTLAATKKFRDSLAGRKRIVELVPVMYEELNAFGVKDLQRRLLRGGLPPVLLGAQDPEAFFPEWLDSYFARDIQELFRIEKRTAFLRALQLVMRQSGGLLDVSKLATAAEVSRPTVMSWLEVFEITHAMRIVRPFSGGGRREITAQPKIYGFDTGLVAHVRGWDHLRPEDCGSLWEHVVLETLVARGGLRVQYWRDKQAREVDFVVAGRGGSVDAIECKWRASSSFDGRSLKAFRALYPKGRNYLVAPIQGAPYERKLDGMQVTVVSPTDVRIEK